MNEVGRPEDLISPMKLAKKLGRPPQHIYGLVRRNRVTEYNLDGKKAVSEEEVRAAFEEGGPRRRRDADGELVDVRPFKEGQLLVWEVRKRVGEVNDEQWIDYVCGGERRFFMFDRVAMKKKIREGAVIVEEPLGVLELVAESLDVCGRSDLAHRVRLLVEDLRTGDP